MATDPGREAVPDLAVPRRFKRVDLTDPALAVPPAPPDLHGLIYSGMRHVISGPPEAAKTLISYAILLHIVRAGDPVAIIDFEMGAVAARGLLDELDATTEDLHGIFFVSDPEGPPTEHDIAAIHAHRAQLVLIDASAGAFDASGLDDNKRQDVEAFAKQWVRPLWQTKVATLLLDHVTKNVDTRGKFTIGSERKTGGADVHLGCEPVNALHRGGHAVVKVRVHKDRRGFLDRPFAYVVDLASHPDTHHVTVTFKQAEHTDEETGVFRPTILMERVSRHLEAQTEPISRNQVEKDVKGNAAYLRSALDVLTTEHYIIETKGQHGARMVATQKPFRDTSDDPESTSSSNLVHLRPSSSKDEVSSSSSILVHPLQGGTRDEDEDEDEQGGKSNSSSSKPTADPEAAEIERLFKLYGPKT